MKELSVAGPVAGRCRAVASCALDLGLPAPALEACNSPYGLRQHASPLRGRFGASAQVPSRSAMRPPVTTPPPPRSDMMTAGGWREGEVSMARTGGSAMEVRSDRTPQPARGRLCFSAAIIACVALAVIGCAHVGRTVVREIVWQGEVTIQGSVVVDSGERLVIRPGTRVLFAFQDENGDGAGDSSIVIKGSIDARGTEGALIVFAPANPAPAGTAGWNEVLIEDAASAEFSRCRFAGAQQAVHAHRTPLVVEDCRFENNGIGLRFTGGPVMIRRNRFVANGTAVRYWESDPVVVANEFAGNATGVFVREGSARSVVTGNNFFSSTDYHVKLGESQAVDVEARDNWWGSDRREEIGRLIFDREDVCYLGRVRYDPPASRPLRLDASMP